MYTLHYIYTLHNIFVGHLGAVKALKSAHIANIDEHVNMCKAQSVRQRPPKIWVYSNHFCVFNENCASARNKYEIRLRPGLI